MMEVARFMVNTLASSLGDGMSYNYMKRTSTDSSKDWEVG